MFLIATYSIVVSTKAYTTSGTQVVSTKLCLFVEFTFLKIA